jgi:hypothetical protein
VRYQPSLESGHFSLNSTSQLPVKDFKQDELLAWKIVWKEDLEIGRKNTQVYTIGSRYTN